MRKDTGFTLHELMVVIAIISILATFAVPNVLNWLPRQRVGGAAMDVMSAVEFARSRAISDNVTVDVNFDFGNDRLTVVNPDGVTLFLKEMPADVDLTDSGLGTPLQFDSRGFASQSGLVTVENTSDATLSRNISVTLGGNVSIQ
jgi:prepilin-type N-terminal cleavage/methylation domain-containing protein